MSPQQLQKGIVAKIAVRFSLPLRTGILAEGQQPRLCAMQTSLSGSCIVKAECTRVSHAMHGGMSVAHTSTSAAISVTSRMRACDISSSFLRHCKGGGGGEIMMSMMMSMMARRGGSAPNDHRFFVKAFFCQVQFT